jgi:hypothetical protein
MTNQITELITAVISSIIEAPRVYLIQLNIAIINSKAYHFYVVGIS